LIPRYTHERTLGSFLISTLTWVQDQVLALRQGLSDHTLADLSGID